MGNIQQLQVNSQIIIDMENMEETNAIPFAWELYPGT